MQRLFLALRRLCQPIPALDRCAQQPLPLESIMQSLVAEHLHKCILFLPGEREVLGQRARLPGLTARRGHGFRREGEPHRPVGSRKKSDDHSPGAFMESKTKVLDQMRQVVRLTHLSISTEKAYGPWAKRLRLFHHKRHPADMSAPALRAVLLHLAVEEDRKSTRLNSSHLGISYAVFCLKKKK